MSLKLTENEAILSRQYDPKLSANEVQHTISKLGIKKANTKAWQILLLSLLAGLYISIGAHVFLVALEQGGGKILGGFVFSVGLILVVIAGAELFTGNIILIVGAISTLISVKKVLKNWTLVYLGNFVGAFFFAWLIYQAGLLTAGDIPTRLGEVAAKVAEAKLALPFAQAFIRGVLCNILVILAIIMSYFAKDIISKAFCCVFPIAVFVACGYEHCVANMFLIPAGLFAKGLPFYEHYPMFANIIPVTLGNIVGGIIILLIHPNRVRQIMILLNRKKSSAA